MGNVQNLTNAEGKSKLKELAKAADICFFTTNLTQLPLAAVPMSTLDADDDGDLWFFSRDDSDKNKDIEQDKRVQLFYANNGSAEFLSVYGTATIIRDKEKAKELWTPIAKAWFEDGADDPHLTIIKVTPSEAYYWDTKYNKMITLLQITVAAITGKNNNDGGVEGKIQP